MGDRSIVIKEADKGAYHIATKISAIWLATMTSIFAVSAKERNMIILHCSANMRKKFKMAYLQRPPENQLKRHVLVWVTATLLIK